MHAETGLHISTAELLDLVVLPPATWSTFPAGNVKLSPAAGALLQKMGLKTGWPDILVIHGGVYGIELKAGKGVLKPTRIVTARGRSRLVEGQREVFQRLMAAGMQIEVCRSADDVLVALKRWGVPIRVNNLIGRS
jgi:hypothetical protein